VFVLLRSGAVIELVDVPPALRWPLAAAWLLGVCNAFNLLDILDGLAAGVGVLAALALGVVAVVTGSLPEAAAAFALAGALAGFLVFNFHPARIYLGDAGSLTIGITLGALALALPWTGSSPAGFLAPLAILVVPLADTAYVSVLRARAGKPFWHGSADHFPLRLRRLLGGDVRRTALVCYLLAAVGGAIGIGAASLWSWPIALWTLGGLAAVVLVLLGVLARIDMEAPQ